MIYHCLALLSAELVRSKLFLATFRVTAQPIQQILLLQQQVYLQEEYSDKDSKKSIGRTGY